MIDLSIIQAKKNMAASNKAVGNIREEMTR